MPYTFSEVLVVYSAQIAKDLNESVVPEPRVQTVRLWYKLTFPRTRPWVAGVPDSCQGTLNNFANVEQYIMDVMSKISDA